MKPPPPYPATLCPPNPSFGPLVDAAYNILVEVVRPLHSRDLRRILLERRQFDAESLQYLDLAMNREIQLGGNRFRLMDSEPGTYCLVTKRTVNEDLEKEKIRYKKMKKQVKHMIFINACYCDQVREQQEKLKTAEQERKFLLHRCMQFEVKARIEAKQASQPASRPAAKPLKHNVQKKKTITKLSKEILTKSKKKSRPATVNKRVASTVKVDSSGKPVYPIALDNLTIHSLGDVLPDVPSFHTPEHIYPAGFCSTRIYACLDNPERKCIYTCKIVQADDGGPRFEISPDDRPDFVITGFTATECHRRLLSMINTACGADVLNLTKNRGADFFGFSHPTVQNLIQNSRGAQKCTNYKFVKFEVMKRGLEAPPFMDHAVALNFDALQRYPAFKGAMNNKRQISAGAPSNPSLRTLLTSNNT